MLTDSIFSNPRIFYRTQEKFLDHEKLSYTWKIDIIVETTETQNGFDSVNIEWKCFNISKIGNHGLLPNKSIFGYK